MEQKLPLWKRPPFRKKVFAPALSALLLLAAYSPLDRRFLVFVALVPWLMAFPYEKAKDARRAGFVFGLIFMTGQMFFVSILVTKWTGNWMLGAIPLVLCGLLGSCYFVALGPVINWCCKSGRMWLIPFAWIAVELWRSYMPVMAFPWGLIATPLAPYPALINSAIWLTVYGVGGWIVGGNLLILAAIQKRLPVAGLAAFAAVLASSLFFYSRPVTGTPRHIIIGQPGIDMGFTDEVKAHALAGPAMNRIIDVGEQTHADLTVLPEGMVEVPGATPTDLGFRPRADAPLLFGAQRGKNPGYQSAFAFDGKWQYADKTRLVIFGEFFPGRQFLPESFHLPTGDLQAGDKVTSLKIGNLMVAPIICFEEMFPDICYKQRANGSQVLAIISMDDWFQHTPAAEQLRDTCAFRAIETGLPVVRSTSTGFSLAFDQRGRVIAEAEPFTWAALPVTVLTK